MLTTILIAVAALVLALMADVLLSPDQARLGPQLCGQSMW